MAPVMSLCLFKEIRIGNEAVAGSVIQIEVPSISAAPTFIRNSHPKRRILQNLPSFKDDEDFAKSLASSGSIYFSATKRYPRSIVWRTFQRQKVLQLRSVDLSKHDQDIREATIVLQLVFPSAIRDGGVALVDAEDQDYLSLFVLTKGSDLYTFTLRRDSFCSAAASEEDIGKWCRIFKPSSFSISTPYRLFAANSRRLVISLSDGRLLHLTRKSEDDGSLWHEVTYSDGQWGSSLRSLVRWQGSNIVKFDGVALDQDTPTGLAFAPDAKHAFVVCLNHTLKIWNLDVPRSVFSADILGQNRDPHEILKMMLDPGTSYKVQIFQAETITNGDLYYVMVFSPHNLGQFKIWAVRDPDAGALGVRDLFPELTLRPPDPDPSPESKAIWKVADFKVNSAVKGRRMEMWILMRSNKYYRLYNLKFDIQNFVNIWGYDWSMTVLEPQQPQPHVPADGPEDIRDLWLSYFLHPGRYPETVLETALSMYTTTRKLNSPKKTKGSLPERIGSLIASNVRLEHDEEGNMDCEKYYAGINQEWYLFWQDVRDLTTSRWDALSFAYDENANMPWIVFADGYSAIRDCTGIEVMAHNARADLSRSMNLLESPSIEIDDGDKEPKLPDELAVIIQAAAAFRLGLNHSLRRTCSNVLTTELWQDPVFSVPVRMQAFYDRCNFAEEVTAKSISDLEAVLEPIGGYGGLETHSFLIILDKLTQLMSTDASDLTSSTFGLKVLVEGAQGMIDLHERILVDLLVMVVFVNAEIDTEENSMENFDAAQLYVILLDLLKQYQMMQWLAKNVRAEKDHGEIQSTTASLISRQTSTKPNEGNVSTILENLFAVDTKPQAYSEQSQSTALTHNIQDILRWTIGGNEPTVTLDRVLVYVQCNLLANNNITLASDFLRYQPSTAWATYIKGRLYLARGEFTEAAIYFKKAAYKLCKLLLVPKDSKASVTNLPASTTSITYFWLPVCVTQSSFFPRSRSFWLRPCVILHSHPNALRIFSVPLLRSVLRAARPSTFAI